jgi:hypothetical protein
MPSALKDDVAAVGRPVRILIWRPASRQTSLVRSVRVHEVHVPVAVPLAGERDRCAVRRPCGEDVFHAVGRQSREVRTVRIDHEQLELLPFAPPAGKDDARSVRRPRGLEPGSTAHLFDVASIGIHHVDVASGTSLEPLEDDLGSIR